LLYAAGGEYMLLAMLILVPGTILFALARRSAGQRVFAPREWAVFALAGAVAAVVMLANGTLTL
jgi:arginine:ornithine antiporter/lysine permease